MDRPRDYTSPRRASLPSISILASLAQLKFVENDTTSSTSPVSVASEPVSTTTPVCPPSETQPSKTGQFSQTASQAQTAETKVGQSEVAPAQVKSAKDANTSKPKKKGKARKKKHQAGDKPAASETLVSQEEVLELAQTLIGQNEAVTNRTQELYSLLHATSQEVIEKSQQIEHKDGEISEINTKLESMATKFHEAHKQLNIAQEVTSEAIPPGEVLQELAETELELNEKLKALSARTGNNQVGNWSLARTNKFLKDLNVIALRNAEHIKSDRINDGLKCMAETLFYHGRYDDEYAPMLFHLANGHDYNSFLDKSREQDHKAASSQEAKYTTWLMNAAAKNKKSTAEAKQSGCGDNKCPLHGCHCGRVELEEFEKWVTKLRAAMEGKGEYPTPPPSQFKDKFLEGLIDLSKTAEAAGLSVSIGPADGQDVNTPGVNFIYEKCKHVKSRKIPDDLWKVARKAGFRLRPVEKGGKYGFQILVNEVLQPFIVDEKEVPACLIPVINRFVARLGEKAGMDDYVQKEVKVALWTCSTTYYNHNVALFNQQCGGATGIPTPEMIEVFSGDCVKAAVEHIRKDELERRGLVDCEAGALDGVKL